MMLKGGKKLQNKVVGVNQSIRELNKNNVDYVYIAEDADKNVIEKLVKACNEKEICIKYVETMNKLGKMFNVEVKVAAVSILK